MIRATALAVGAVAGLIALGAATQTLAWGASGHRMVGEAAMRALTPDLPAFLRTAQAAADVGELSREPDRAKGAGKAHDANLDPAHYVDVDDDGRVLGGPRLDALPPDRPEYEASLRSVGQDGWKAGYLPYSILEERQRLVQDFAYWRALDAAVKNRAWRRDHAWFRADLRRREAAVFATIGRLGHFVGDGSQPLHVTLHYNGWVDLPNPRGFTTAKIHSPFEGAFVRANVTPAAVRAQMAPFQPCSCAPERRVAEYLLATYGQVEPFYALEKAGGLAPGDPRGRSFAERQLGRAASELRDVVVEAWRASAEAKVGWPAVPVADVVSGKTNPYLAFYGRD